MSRQWTGDFDQLIAVPHERLIRPKARVQVSNVIEEQEIIDYLKRQGHNAESKSDQIYPRYHLAGPRGEIGIAFLEKRPNLQPGH